MFQKHFLEMFPKNVKIANAWLCIYLKKYFGNILSNAVNMHALGEHKTHTPGNYHTPKEPNWVLHGQLCHFVASKFARTKVCGTYPLAERDSNFPKMAFFKTKFKTGTKTSLKLFENVGL